MNIRRRRLIAGGLVLAAIPQVVLPQAAGRIWRVGCLTLAGNQSWFAPVIGELFNLGYEERKNIAFDYKFAGRQQDRLDAMAREMVTAKVDLIMAPANMEILAAKRATQTIPIVMLFPNAPVETGLIASLARPGGNITGTSTNTPAMAAKSIELLREIVPGLKRVALLYETTFPGVALYVQQAERAAAVLGIHTVTLSVRSYNDLDVAFAAMERERPDAMLVGMAGTTINPNAARVAGFAAGRRLPVLYALKWPVTYLEGLMSYSANFVSLAKRNAAMIDRIFRGAKPADIPTEEPTEFELVINRRAAKSLGITIPQSVLLRADEVIQ